MAGDPHYANVSLLLHCDGANDSTVINDSSITPKTITSFGNTKISTAQSKFGGASAYFDGTGGYLGTPIASAGPLDISGDFTVEGWVYLNSLSAAAQGVFFAGVYGSNTNRIQLDIKRNGSAAFFAATTVTSWEAGSAAGAFAINTWTHFAAVKDGAECRLYIDGQLAGTSAVVSTPVISGGSFYIGYARNASINRYLNGYIDDFRVTKSVARYTADFTPPAAAFLNYVSQLSGVVRDDTGALCARTVRAYDRATGVLSGSTVSDPSTGAFTVNTLYTGTHTVIALDDSAGTAYNALVFDNVMPA